jgi:hypothetical protein
MSLILIQENASTIPLPDTGRGTLFLNEADQLVIKDTAGNVFEATGIGVNQTWQTVTRSIDTTYTNSTGKPIAVAITVTCSAANSVQGLTINGVNVYAGSVNVAGQASGFSLVVPADATYATVTNAGTLTLSTWVELR